MRIVLESKENDECSPLDTVAIVAFLAREIVANKSNDGSGNIYGGSFVVAETLYKYEVQPNNNAE